METVVLLYFKSNKRFQSRLTTSLKKEAKNLHARFDKMQLFGHLFLKNLM